MELVEDEILQKNGNYCLENAQCSLLPYEYEHTCIARDYNVIIQKKQTYKKLNFIKRLIFARQKLICN